MDITHIVEHNRLKKFGSKTKKYTSVNEVIVNISLSTYGMSTIH